MKNQLTVSANTIYQRLLARNEQLDRLIGVELAAWGLFSTDLGFVDSLGMRFSPEEIAHVQRESEERLPDAQISWESLKRPSLEQLQSRYTCALRRA
jgi:hypothetical protein